MTAKKKEFPNFLAVQWLGFHDFTAEGAGSIPVRGTKVPQAVHCGQKKFCHIIIFLADKIYNRNNKVLFDFSKPRYNKNIILNVEDSELIKPTSLS